MIQLMTDKKEVHDALSPLIIFTYTLCCFDFYQGITANLLRGVGQQNYAAKIYILSYYAIGIPLGILLGVVMKLTIVGWIGSMHLSQAVFCFFGHRKFQRLNIEEVIEEVENACELQFSQRSIRLSNSKI